jgi:hypothetical protein
MGLAIGAQSITFGANVHDVTVPALLVAGTLDTTAPASISQDAFNMLGSTDKQIILIQTRNTAILSRVCVHRRRAPEALLCGTRVQSSISKRFVRLSRFHLPESRWTFADLILSLVRLTFDLLSHH